MNTVKNETTEVHGAAGFPAWTILLSFVVLMIGWAVGNTFAGVVGMLGLVGSILSLEFITFGPAARETHHRITSGSKVMHV